MISVTLKAQERLAAVINSRGAPEAAVRVAAVGGVPDCIHGWRLAIESRPHPQDTVTRVGALRLVVSPDLVDLLRGACIDYSEDIECLGFSICGP